MSPEELEKMACKMDSVKAEHQRSGSEKKKKKSHYESPEEIKVKQLVEFENIRLKTLIDWAPERKAILEARLKRKKLAAIKLKKEKEMEEQGKQRRRRRCFLGVMD